MAVGYIEWQEPELMGTVHGCTNSPSDGHDRHPCSAGAGSYDFTDNPGNYLLDLYADEVGAAKAWTRAGESHHFTHNDGVITLAWDGIPLLGIPQRTD